MNSVNCTRCMSELLPNALDNRTSCSDAVDSDDACGAYVQRSNDMKHRVGCFYHRGRVKWAVHVNLVVVVSWTASHLRSVYDENRMEGKILWIKWMVA